MAQRRVRVEEELVLSDLLADLVAHASPRQ
jgi:hypothetical protein